MCNLNVIVVLEYISRDLYLLFAIGFSSKFQNSVFYQHVRPKSGLKSPRPFTPDNIYYENNHIVTNSLIKPYIIDSLLSKALFFQAEMIMWKYTKFLSDQ